MKKKNTLSQHTPQPHLLIVGDLKIPIYYWMEEDEKSKKKFYWGYLVKYPTYKTKAKSINDLEEKLKEVFFDFSQQYLMIGGDQIIPIHCWMEKDTRNGRIIHWGYIIKYPTYKTKADNINGLKNNLKKIFNDLSNGIIRNNRIAFPRDPFIGIDTSYYDWLKENKSIFDEFEENIGLLPTRLNNYIIKLDLLLTNDELAELKRKTIGVLGKRYLEGIEQRLGEAIEHDEASGLNITIERLSKDFDELLCSVEPKFRSVVEYKPIDDLKDTKENKVEHNKDDTSINVQIQNSGKKLERITYEKIKKLISELPINILEETDKFSKRGNQKWKHTEGKILSKIEPLFDVDLTKGQKNVVIKHIQRYRNELQQNKTKKK